MIAQTHPKTATSLAQQDVKPPVLNPNLHLQLNLLGMGFLIFALITSFLLYGSFGHDAVEKNAYRLMGLLLCLATAVMLRIAYTLWANNNEYMAVLALVIYCCLFFVEWSTTLGFTAVSQSHVKENTGAAKIVNQRASIADLKLEQVAQFSGLNLADLERRKTLKNNHLVKLNRELIACPPRDYTHCKKPKQTRIDALNLELSTLNRDLINANKYTHALNEKQSALNMALASNGSVEQYHPLFKVQSKIFDLEIKEVESDYLGFSSLICTILTSLLFLFASILKQRFILIPANDESESSNRPSVGNLLHTRLEQALSVKKT